MHRCLLLMVLVVVAVPADAQSPNAQRRRDEIARVQELVTDPDPLQRLANFEEIAAEGDAIKLQTAVRVTLTGDDPLLRGLAFRAFLGGVKRFLLDMSFEPAQQQRLERARQAENARDDTANLRGFQQATAMRADFKITEFDVATGRGNGRVGWASGGNRDFELQVIGERLIATVVVDNLYNNCTLELRPTRDLQILGNMVCQGATMGRIVFAGPMY